MSRRLLLVNMPAVLGESVPAGGTYEPQHFMAGAPQCPAAPVPGRDIKPLVEPTLPRRLVRLDGELGPAVGPDYAHRSL